MRPVVCVPQGVTFMYEPQVYPAVFPLSAVSAKDVSSVSAGFSACPSCEASAGASVRQQEMTPRTCKKLVASAWQREGVYNRTGEPSVTFCAKEETQRNELAGSFCKNVCRKRHAAYIGGPRKAAGFAGEGGAAA